MGPLGGLGSEMLQNDLLEASWAHFAGWGPKCSKLVFWRLPGLFGKQILSIFAVIPLILFITFCVGAVIPLILLITLCVGAVIPFILLITLCVGAVIPFILCLLCA